MNEFYNYKKLENGKFVTCAVVIIDNDGNILACHSTGRKENEGYDFPKGMANAYETDLQAATRELREETGLELTEAELSHVCDCGIHKHNNEKDIHIFIYPVDSFPSIDSLKCTSYFEQYGKQVPEVESFAILSPKERYKFNRVLQNKFDMIDGLNKRLRR